MPQYNVSSVLYARVTDVNMQTALSSSGVLYGIEDVIAPVTLETGVITTTAGDATVIGTETDFVRDYSNGDYLYYYSAEGVPVLLGKIQSRDNATQMTLTAEGALYSVTNKNSGRAVRMLTGSENILIRVPVVARTVNSNGVVTHAIIPNLTEWRAINSTAGENSINNPDTSSLARYSNPGDVLSVDTTSTTEEKNIPFTINNLTRFSPGAVRETFFSVGTIPQYVWFVINPYGDNGERLAQKTMFKLFTKISFTNGLLISAGTPQSTLVAAGYNTNF